MMAPATSESIALMNAKKTPANPVIAYGRDDRRRLAPLHFFARAENARYSAFSLWTLWNSKVYPDVNKAGYDRSPDVALKEGWLRESSLALELVVKAVFAQREEGKKEPKVVPAIHDVSRLWDEAKLPSLNEDDSTRLVEISMILKWAGRYAAPNKGCELRSELARRTIPGRSLPPYRWEEFDSLYQRAHSGLCEARESVWGNGRSIC